MEPERWRRVEQLYHSALDCQESERAAFIEQACAGDEALEQELRSLLKAERTDSFLESPAVELAAKKMAPPTAAVRPLAAIGRYRIIRLLGEGGMGAVYEAEQEQPRRVVALKVIRPGFATPDTLRRFQHESQALGRLQHPGIAQIYEASTADTGFGPQPYFAMELIRGCTLREYAEEKHLDTRARLELTAKICDAVEHAHQRGVIHRDLKPGNILVDETGQPKILDFGVARVTDNETQLTTHTDLGQLIGTLAYMSPEQVTGDPLAVDTRSDVYALGVILYELLAGKLPHAVDRKPLPEAVHIIRDDEPARLSSINRTYRGDIDTIVAKALEKDKARRYDSAAALAGDIRRYLADEPIMARRPSASYQLQKFARRHKALVAATTAVFVVLTAGVVASTWEAVRARRAERKAASEAATAEAINDFLQNDLLGQASANNQSNPSTRPDPDLKVRTALDRAAARVAGKFDRRPDVEAAIRDTIGQTYIDLGLWPEGRKHLERSLELRQRVLGAENPKTLKTMDHLGRVLTYPEAETLYSKILAIRRRVLGAEHPDTLSAMRGLANAYYHQGKYPQAEDLYAQALDVSRRVLGAEHPDTVKSMYSLALVKVNTSQQAYGEALFRHALDTRRRVLGPEHPDTLQSMKGLAIAYSGLGKYAQSEALLREILEINRRVLGPEHPDTVTAMNNVAATLEFQGKYPEAERLHVQSVEIARRVLGPERAETLAFMHNLAAAYDANGKYAQALALYNQVLEIRRRVLGPEHHETLFTLDAMAYLYQRHGNFVLAETLEKQVLAGRRRSLGSEHVRTLEAMEDLALSCQSQGKFVESEALAREALTGFQKLEPDSWERFRGESLLGASLAGQKKYAEAEPLLLEGYQGMAARKDQMQTMQYYVLDVARESLVRLYDVWGKPEKAAEVRNPADLTPRSPPIASRTVQ